MSSSEHQNWQAAVYLIALNVRKAAVLLLPDNNQRYTLPHFTAEGDMWDTTTAKLQQQIEPTLHIKGQALYRASYRADEAVCKGEAVLVVDVREPEVLTGEWFTRQRLADVTLANLEHCSLLETVLAELETGIVPAKRPPWARPGWQNQATEWMTAELTTVGLTPVGTAEMVRSWALSYVMRLQAYKDNEDEKQWFYFKTSLELPLFVNEAVVTRELAQLYPGHIPQPLALNATQNWMLLADFGDLVGHEAPLEERLEIIRQFAQMQKQSAEQLEPLLAMGCCDRRLDWMVAEIEHLLTHPEVEKAVTAEEAAELRSMVIPLKSLCRKLFGYAIPNALIHGDLHGGNVARNTDNSNRLLYFDWTDSAVSHPFFDMLLIYTAPDTAEREKMRDLYLSYWLDYEPMERLLESWRLAEVIAAVYHAISYLYIMEGIEEWGKKELDWSLPYWFGKILKYGEFIHER